MEKISELEISGLSFNPNRVIAPTTVQVAGFTQNRQMV